MQRDSVEVDPLHFARDRRKADNAECTQTVGNQRVDSARWERPLLDTTDGISVGKLAYLSGEGRLMLLPRALCVWPDGEISSGLLEMTNYQLRFVEEVNEKEKRRRRSVPTSFTCLPLGTISGLTVDGPRLSVTGKDGRTLVLTLSQEREAHNAYKLVRACAFGNEPRFFCHFHQPLQLSAGDASLWAYDAGSWYRAWRAKWIEAHPTCAPPWRLSDANSSFCTCASYPELLIVPSSIGDGLLANAATFRSEARVPTLSWASTADAASIWRCAQPKVGVQGNKNESDEALVRAIATQGDPPHGCEILDCRPKSSANANRLGGHGYEGRERYKESRISFANMPNIHTVRAAHKQLLTLGASCGLSSSISSSSVSRTAIQRSASTAGINSCEDDGVVVVDEPDPAFDSSSVMNFFTSSLTSSNTDMSWMSLVEDTRWLATIRRLLAAAWDIANKVHNHRARVLVHCSPHRQRRYLHQPRVALTAFPLGHGWDRTSQVVALAQLLLEPECRTLAGFFRLVEKDFVAFGHPFATRCGHGLAKGEDRQRDEQVSPIFIQFLDAVYQLISLFPNRFEFDSRLLVHIADQLYACRFDTFLFDNLQARRGAYQDNPSIALWDYLYTNADALKSPIYSPPDTTPLLPPLVYILRNVQLWADYHMRYSPSPTTAFSVRTFLAHDDDDGDDGFDESAIVNHRDDPDAQLQQVPHTNAIWVTQLRRSQRQASLLQREWFSVTII